MLDDDITVHAYEIADRPGALLCIGRPEGRTRPALWIKSPEGTVILAQFHGEKEAQVAVNFLDESVGQIARVINFYREQNGEL